MSGGRSRRGRRRGGRASQAGSALSMEASVGLHLMNQSPESDA